jgi:glucoside 3-dehydrogenase (cytochrome c) hitch-hiker subunit
MQRRELFRILGAGTMLPALSPEVFAMLQSAQPGSGYKLQTLTPHQNETVVAMIDQIIPATDTPGAKAARVNEFIDIILSEWATETERANFLSGLENVDKRSNALFGKDFVSAATEQQVTLLRAMDDEVMTEPKPKHHGSVPPEDRDDQLRGNFWKVFKGITLHGYYTSEIGFTQELKLQIIPGAQHGCTPVGPGIGEA